MMPRSLGRTQTAPFLFLLLIPSFYSSSWPTAPTHTCSSSSSWQGWANSRDDAETLFYKQADWGYLQARQEEMKALCTSSNLSASHLECSSHLTYCRASNIMFDFRGIENRIKTESLRYSTDIFSPGQVLVSGCHLDTSALATELTQHSALQSWAPELTNLQAVQSDLVCDVTVTTPTLIVKLDAIVNMYHHFCDFFNIYISMQLNQSMAARPGDRQILILDNHPYYSIFQPVWSAFSTRSLWNLATVAGQRVCFTDLVLPLPPRMMFGLYYNTPLIPGCASSSMFAAFSSFLVSSLDITQLGPVPGSIVRLTLLSRDTKYRRILNEEQLVSALESTGLYQVHVAKFSPSLPFLSQLSLTHNTDLLAGLHGAGLTHTLLLPDWAQVIELYNCEDPECYRDLARLRGVGYTTWDPDRESLIHRVEGDSRDPNTRGPAHKKFASYEFDVRETVRLVGEAREKVIKHPQYLAHAHTERYDL